MGHTMTVDHETIGGKLELLYQEFLSDHPKWEEAKALINEIGQDVILATEAEDAWRDDVIKLSMNRQAYEFYVRMFTEYQEETVKRIGQEDLAVAEDLSLLDRKAQLKGWK